MNTFAVLVGVALIVAGTLLISVSAGLIVAGVLIAAMALASET